MCQNEMCIESEQNLTKNMRSNLVCIETYLDPKHFHKPYFKMGIQQVLKSKKTKFFYEERNESSLLIEIIEHVIQLSAKKKIKGDNRLSILPSSITMILQQLLDILQVDTRQQCYLLTLILQKLKALCELNSCANQPQSFF